MYVPDDVLIHLASFLPVLSRAALCRASVHFSRVLSDAPVWAHSAAQLGILRPPVDQGLMQLVCAIAALEELLAATEVALGIHWIAPASAEGAAVVRRLQQLEPHGVVSLAQPTGELIHGSGSSGSSPSLAVVCCDATNGSRWAPALSLAAGHAPRYVNDNDVSSPCARRGCFNLAVVNHQHCTKHSGAGATRYVAMCAQQLTCLPWPEGPRRFIFAVPNSVCRDAYRRAGLALASEQQRGS